MPEMYEHANYALGIITYNDPQLTGFIAGAGNGIVTVDGKPGQKRIIVFERIDTLPILRTTWSNADGTYLIDNLDKDKTYLVMAFDDKQKYEPVAWDFIKAAIRDA